jgi:hypothetical protein
MVMQHYTEPTTTQVTENKESILKKYFAEAEEEVIKEKEERRAVLNQYASKIASRVLEGKESAREKWIKASHEREKKHAEREAEISKLPKEKRSGASIDALEKHLRIKEDLDQNQPDTVTVDVPLLIRLLEYAREDAKTDMDLHNVAEKLISFSQNGDVLTMNNYDAIVGDQQALPAPEENVMEKAPPGSKAERMVKHIKSGYAKDGKLTDKEKSIAYATAWKAHNKK